MVALCKSYLYYIKISNLGNRNLPDEKLHHWSHQTLPQVAVSKQLKKLSHYDIYFGTCMWTEESRMIDWLI